jgi:hypothetical protein
MGPNLPTNSTIDGKVKVTGIVAITCNALFVFGFFAFEFQSRGHGEMANFFANSMVWTFPFAGWGIVTGIGLLRVWRWARISTLIFSGLLAAFGVAEAVASLLMPGDVDTPRWELIMFKTFLILLDLIPIAAGIAWLVFFTRKDVKAYFQAGAEGNAPRVIP